MTFPAYSAYKDSGVEWLGEVPEHWEVLPLKHLAEVDNSGCYGVEPSDGDYVRPVATTAQIDSEGRFDVGRMSDRGFSAQELSRYECSPGDVLIVKSSGSAENIISGKAGLVRQDTPAFVFSNFLMRLRHRRDTCLPSFLYALLISHLTRERIKQMCSTTTYPNLQVGLYTSAKLPCPSMSEQTQIARFLDNETARIDALIEEQQRLIELLKEKRQAVISHTVTKGLDPMVLMKGSGVDWLGEVPAHWAVKRLKQLVIDAAGIQMGPFGGMLVDLDDSDTGYKVYGQENTISGDFSSGNRWVPAHRFFALSNYHLEVGDIVLTRKGSLGNCRRVSLLPQAGIIDSDTIRVRVQDHMMNPDYLELLLHEAGYISTQLSLVKRGAILSGLNSEIIANLVIVVPPREEQEELLQEVKAASSKSDQGISDCEYAVGLLRERRSALISAAVTGKIDVRGWQSPASAPTPELAQEAG